MYTCKRRQIMRSPNEAGDEWNIWGDFWFFIMLTVQLALHLGFTIQFWTRDPIIQQYACVSDGLVEEMGRQLFPIKLYLFVYTTLFFICW